MQSLDTLYKEIIESINVADNLKALEAIRIDALGKKGRISLLMRELGGMDAETRKAVGQNLNALKDDISKSFTVLFQSFFSAPPSTSNLTEVS